MIFKDYYKILGLDTNKASMDELKTAYRVQAKKYHPDVNVGNNMAAERFKDINEAYSVLSDSASRKKYDRMWNSKIGKRKQRIEQNRKPSEGVVNDFVNILFGNVNEKNDKKIEKKIEKIKGENIETQIDVSIQEAFYGATKKISLRTIDDKNKNIDIVIPKGITNGQTIRLLGQGKEGTNGGKNGDLYIKINIKDSKVYKLIDMDLHTELLLTPWEASLGTKLELNAIDETISLIVPEGIGSGEKVTIPGKGYKNANGERGDLIAEVKIVVPKDLSKEERKIYKKLKEISKFEPRKSVIE